MSLSWKSKTDKSTWVSLNWSNKVNSSHPHKHISSSNLNIYYAWKIVLKISGNNNFEITSQVLQEKFNCLFIFLMSKLLISVHNKNIWHHLIQTIFPVKLNYLKNKLFSYLVLLSFSCDDNLEFRKIYHDLCNNNNDK